MSLTEAAPRKRVLLTILDWGLGHATRSIPIIRKLKEQHCDVLIASSGDALKLLKSEFPDYAFFELEPYNVKYSNSIPLMLKLFFQAPKFLWVMWKEHLEVEKIVTENEIDIVISDNRYGCWTRGVHSILITHQVNLIIPRSIGWLGLLVNKNLKRRISQFNEVWIPDDRHKLTSKLTCPTPRSFRFVGVLSRFTGLTNADTSDYDFVAVLSGPEPQRTEFEERIVGATSKTNFRALVVRGVYDDQKGLKSSVEGVTFISHCNSAELEILVQGAKTIVCRSGYSSIMDLASLQKGKVLFVPTPGQTEQEYLANLLHENRIAPFQRQEELDLVQGLKDLDHYSGFAGWPNDSNLLDNAIQDLLK